MPGSRTAGLFVKNDAQAMRKAEELEKWLTQQGIGVVREETCAPILLTKSCLTSSASRSVSPPFSFLQASTSGPRWGETRS